MLAFYEQTILLPDCFIMRKTKAFLVINKHVKTQNQPLIEGVFWKRKNARRYAQQLIEKTGTLRYRFLYEIIKYEFFIPAAGE